MPANLTPQYYAAEERYKAAKDDREKMKALKAMLGIMPKHKGTEKLQAEIKRKIALLREELESGKGKGTHRISYRVDREGAGQVAVVGTPNVGKTMLVNSMTNAAFETADYPFTTRMFQPAMMPYEDLQIQLIDLPPISMEHMENWMPSIIVNSDALLIVIDLASDDLLEEVDTIFSILNHHKMYLFQSEDQEYDERWLAKKALFVGSKLDRPESTDNLKIFNEFYADSIHLHTIGLDDAEAVERLKADIFRMLDIVRIYSKRPGYAADFSNPFVLPAGSDLLAFAGIVHHDFEENLKYARVWNSDKYQGQRITRDYILHDKDVIELHM
ncbi:50S ribosome-binding GTPase [candidate division KSB1 bacterium]|nr:50S ribosome-binding GTPase [candidate division KSB1 bacterium]